MKKNFLMVSASLFALLLGVTSCGSEQVEEKFVLPDLYNVTLRDAKLSVGANVLFETNVVPTTELVENRILGYVDYQAGNEVEKGSTIKINVASRVEDAKSYDKTSIINYSSAISQITGYDSINSELFSNHGIGGTDLGIPFELPDGRMMLLYGDTFSSKGSHSGRWNSNFMAITSDTNLSDGLTFDEIVSQDNGLVIPFAEGNHSNSVADDPNNEVTKIPTGGISIGNDVYIFYMSIRYWGEGGSWIVNYNQAVKAKDHTYKQWENVPSLRWNHDELYYAGQIYPFNDPKDQEHIYFTSIPGGRNDGAIMFRVDKDKFENKNEYEYLVANNTWLKGKEGIDRLNENPHYILSPGVAEPAIMYSSYLDKYIFTTMKSSVICLCLADRVTGPYNEIHAVLELSDYWGLYGGFLHPKFTDTDGQRLYLQLSQWLPIYNTTIIEIVLK